MRTTIIPAQITTVEDRIAGSLNMSQILILMFPVLFSAVIYIVFYPAMKLASYKIILVAVVVAVCIGLVIRVKDKIVAKWLLVLISYILRPRFYVFNKNNLTNREVAAQILPIDKQPAKNIKETTAKVFRDEIKLTDLVRLNHLINAERVELNFQLERKRV